jgi:dTDP-4-amino-4,6-dideoxygalactose transaminase
VAAGQYPGASERCPNACLWGDQTITLPMFPGLTAAEQDHVTKTVHEEVYPLSRQL